MRFGMALLMGWSLGACAQNLPPTAPTLPPAATLPVPTRLEQAPAKRALIGFDGQVLQIAAENASLNQILREVSRVTGMKVTGGVTEERVFGLYGPAEPAAVLTALLKGTGSNMLLMVDAQKKPTELVLTPRQGGSSPPNPNAVGRDVAEDEDPDTPPQLSQHVQRERVPVSPTPEPGMTTPAMTAPGTVRPGASSSGVAQGDAVPVDSAPAVVPAATTTEQSPNGVKTPQQIYDQLLRLQQQQSKP